MDLESFESVERWLRRLKKKSDSGKTRRAYLRYLRVFCSFIGMNLDELISSRREDLKSDDEMVRTRHEELLDKWFAHLHNPPTQSLC